MINNDQLLRPKFISRKSIRPRNYSLDDRLTNINQIIQQHKQPRNQYEFRVQTQGYEQIPYKTKPITTPSPIKYETFSPAKYLNKYQELQLRLCTTPFEEYQCRKNIQPLDKLTHKLNNKQKDQTFNLYNKLQQIKCGKPCRFLQNTEQLAQIRKPL